MRGFKLSGFLEAIFEFFIFYLKVIPRRLRRGCASAISRVHNAKILSPAARKEIP
ncbi:MAG: hypothetical protein QG575_339 [Euryarchaeota archaeon]|nr:hypothetical protein [Euryarchaeota archaeon]